MNLAFCVVCCFADNISRIISTLVFKVLLVASVHDIYAAGHQHTGWVDLYWCWLGRLDGRLNNP